MNDLVAAAFELVENFGQRKDGAGVNVVQQQDALAPPPLKWSDLRYVFDIKEDCNGKDAIQA
jgi:hypothetical protein